MEKETRNMEHGVVYARTGSCQSEQSIENQINLCKEYAEEQGISIVKVYADLGKSGLNTDRPAFQEMISNALNGSFGKIIVNSIDRFSRDRLKFIACKAILNFHGVELVSATEQIGGGDLDKAINAQVTAERLYEIALKEYTALLKKARGDRIRAGKAQAKRLREEKGNE